MIALSDCAHGSLYKNQVKILFLGGSFGRGFDALDSANEGKTELSVSQKEVIDAVVCE